MAQTSEQRAVRRAMEGAWKQAGQAAAGMEQAIAAALTRVSSAAGQAAGPRFSALVKACLARL